MHDCFEKDGRLKIDNLLQFADECIAPSVVAFWGAIGVLAEWLGQKKKEKEGHHINLSI